MHVLRLKTAYLKPQTSQDEVPSMRLMGMHNVQQLHTKSKKPAYFKKKKKSDAMNTLKLLKIMQCSNTELKFQFYAKTQLCQFRFYKGL